ncbi:MAG TPA: tRNA (N(6)-L-threonylcarbamoyladenosine(37)-C(2))-methylthiotransferase MtaB [Candidatus Brocadiia bacterium]|nr:tRNA (N(6)-L-threonylcarbamoyladenosine(37)-C(2))-methylthiotransferase MtaB [Candidatus Brocadiales bacterium]
MCKKTCAFITLGCKVNQYETQAIRESIIAKGYREVLPDEQADLYVINTCTVTSVSDEKSRAMIRKAVRSKANAKVVVTGCYVDADKKTVERLEGVDYVFENAEKANIADVLEPKIPPHPPLIKGGMGGLKEVQVISRFDGHTRAFLKIEDGCDVFCSYCIIPYVRGRVRSKGLDVIVEEAGRLAGNGYKEIVLTGIHLGAYGRDLQHVGANGRSPLLDVLRRLEEIDNLERIRLSSIEVNELEDEMINLVATSKKICPHFHLSLQSGSDYILSKMNRRYTSAQYLTTLDKIRAKIELPSFSTDVMVGFPGETEEHFQDTIKVCCEAGFSRMHIFPYSVRNGTPAAKMSGRCKSQEIKQREILLKSVADKLALEYKERFIGETVDVLVEASRDKKTGKLAPQNGESANYLGGLCGYSERYIKVVFDGTDNFMNTIVTVRIKKAFPGFAKGILVE